MATSAVPDANYYDTLGWVYYRRGDLALAREALGRSLEIRPGNVEAVFHLALVHIDERDIAEARKLLARVIELDPAGAFAAKAGELLNGMGKD
jgi:Tfp pilus assembly protein PilF